MPKGILSASSLDQDMCSVDGCDRTISRRGMCGAHYMRWYRTGSAGSRDMMTRAPRGEFTHGTTSGYNKYGCRCDECVAASKLARNKRSCESCGQKCTGAICLTCRRARWVKDCRMCGGTFVRPKGSFCTLTCALGYAAITRTSNERPSTDWKPSPSERQRIVAYLLERDGSSCAICRKRVDLTLVGRDPWMVSIDHVIPRSVGGSNDMSNLRLAHLGCNSSRGNRGGYEQLALVG